MTETETRTAIVTGSSKGIGAAIARRLARDGFAVVVNYASGAEAAAAVVGEIEAAGGRAMAVQADIASSDGMKALFDAAEETFGGVDVLVNNAGIMQLSPIADTSDEAFERQVAINLGGVFRGMREGANRIRPGGRIISFSTSVVGLYQPAYGVYAATKAAVEAMTHILQGTRAKGDHRQCGGAGPGRDRTVHEGQVGRTGQHDCRHEPAEAARPAGRYCRCRLLPRRPGWRLGQRPGDPRQWRRGLTQAAPQRNNTSGE